jgi:hypothetical protein
MHPARLGDWKNTTINTIKTSTHKVMKNKKTLNKFFALAAVLAASSTAANAAVVVTQYNFEANDLASTDGDASTTAGDLTSGIAFSPNTNQAVAGLAIHTTHTDSESAGQPAFNSPVTGSDLAGRYLDIKDTVSLANAISNDYYVGFNLGLAGGSVDLTSFSFDTDYTGGGADKALYLLANTNGGVWDATDQIGTTTQSGTGAFSASFDLSAEADITADTEFRLYLITAASTTSHGFALDNLQLEGTVTAIPEPSTTALLGLGGLALILRRRK